MPKTNRSPLFQSDLITTVTVVTLALTFTLSCSQKKDAPTPAPPECRPDKITFSMEILDDAGLTGPADGKVSLDYEFCIPLDEQYRREVREVDSEIYCRRGPGMRIGCDADQYACLGNTGYQDYRRILCELSAKDYVTRIDRTWWE